MKIIQTLIIVLLLISQPTLLCATDIEIGSFKTDVYGTFVRLREPSQWGKMITVYLFKERLFKRNMQGIKRGNIGSAQSFVRRIGKAPVLTLNIVLKPDAEKCSKENLIALVAMFQQTESMPLGLTTNNLINVDIKKEDAPTLESITEFSCDLKEGASFVLAIDREFTFPSNEEFVDELIEEGDEALAVIWQFRIDSEIQVTK